MRWKQKKREKEGIPKTEVTLERVPDSSSDQGLALPLRKYEKKQKKKKVQCIRESLEGTIYPFFLLFLKILQQFL